MPQRPTPYDLVFAELAPERFPAIRAALAESGVDPHDRDAFLMTREAIELIRELRPEEGVGEAMDQLVALVHEAYLHWLAGAPTLTFGTEATAALLAGRPAASGAADAAAPAPAPPDAFYAQLAERKIWAQLAEGEPHQPLDGCFVSVSAADRAQGRALPALRVLGVFGMHPEQMGFSVVEVAGREPGELRRPDGAPLFAPVLPGGAAAGLASIVGGEELLELGWRMRAAAATAGAAP